MTAMVLWTSKIPLILASGSQTRRAMLEAVGLSLKAVPVDLDERRIEASARQAGLGAADRALSLARAKALAAADRLQTDAMILGADQTLDASGHPGTKARDHKEAAAFLSLLAGKTHRLHSAAAIVQCNQVLFETVTTATLTMRPLTQKQIALYLDHMGEAAMQSVGCYQIEGLGAQLFEHIEGDHWTILGLPLLALLAFWRRRGLLAF